MFVKLKSFKIATSLFIILTVCVSFAYYMGYKSSVKYYHREILKNLDAKSRILSTMIDGDLYEKLIDSKNVDGSIDYEEMMLPLKKAHLNLPEVRYIYTTYFENDKIYFGLDTAPRIDTDNDGLVDHSDFRTEYKDAPLILKKAFYNKEPIISNDPYTDDWGSFVGSFRPIKNKAGTVVGVFAVEMLYTEYQNKINMLTIVGWSVYFIAMCVVFAIAFYMYKLEKVQFDQFKKDLEHKKEIEHKDKILYQESRMVEIGKIMAEIAHEINNPLMIIDSAAQAAKKAIEQSNNEFSHEKNYQRIEKSSKRISAIITNIKTLVKDGSHDPKEIVKLNDIVRESIDMINFRLKDLVVNVEIDDEVLLNVQKIPLQQVFINLISNSVDALVNDKEAWLKISSKIENKNIIIDVEDSGLGIPDDLLAIIEAGYYTTKSTGTGLGLLICKKILKANNGSLAYKKCEHTCFQIILPIYNN